MTISDVLFDAVEEINRYLDDPCYNNMYSGDLRKRIIAIRDAMESIRKELDTPPV